MNNRLSNFITVTLDHPDAGQKITALSIDDLNFSIEKKSNNLFNRRLLTNNFRFTKDDFLYLKSIEENSIWRCEKISIEIKANQNYSGIFDILYTGYISLEDATFRNDDCVLTVDLRVQDGFSVLEEIYEKEINFLDNTVKEDVVHMLSTATIETTNGLTLNEGWALTKEVKTKALSNPTNDPNITIGEYYIFELEYSRFINTFTTAPPIELGWTQIGTTNQYYKEPRTRLIDTVYSSGGTGGAEFITTTYDIVDNLNDTRRIDDAVSLGNVLTKILEGTNYIVKSEFFTINQDGFSAPNNDAYSFAGTYLTSLFLADITSLVNANNKGENSSATIQYITLKQLEENLFTMFEAVMFVDESDTNVLRIEHVSYLENQPVSLNLTGTKWIERKNEYSYDIENKVRSENWAYPIPSDFDGKPFEYNLTCSNESDEGKTKTVDGFVGDYLDFIFNTSYSASKLTAIISTVKYEDENHITSLPTYNKRFLTFGALSTRIGQPQSNGALSFYQLQKNVLTHQRPQLEATWINAKDSFVDDFNFDLQTIKKSKKQVSISIANFTYQDWLTLDVNNFISTQISDEGQILTLDYSLKNNRLKVELLHN